MDSESRVVDSGFQTPGPGFRRNMWILDSIQWLPDSTLWIPHSKASRLLDSGCRKLEMGNNETGLNADLFLRFLQNNFAKTEWNTFSDVLEHVRSNNVTKGHARRILLHVTYSKFQHSVLLLRDAEFSIDKFYIPTFHHQDILVETYLKNKAAWQPLLTTSGIFCNFSK